MRANRCRALFATHYHELTALSAKLPRMFNATVRVKEWQGDVVFLHEVLPGSADRSYGIQVAKLAGLPPAVIARAKSVLAKLEAQDRGQTARALADDLPLFAVPSRAAAEPAPPSEAEQLMEAVKALHPDEMSPREALEALYALKAKLPKGVSSDAGMPAPLVTAPAKGWINFSVAAKRMLRLPASAVASISAPSALQRPEKPMPTS